MRLIFLDQTASPNAKYFFKVCFVVCVSVCLFVFVATKIPAPPLTCTCFLCFLQTQRRVTFHLPDGSQESCSDSGLGEQEPGSTASTSITQPLPLGFPQEEYYEQTSPNSRTEGDGNSDPESSEY